MYSYRDYLQFSKRLFRLAEEETGSLDWLLVPSLLLSWIAIEALISSMLDDFNSLPEDMFQVHERAFMLEKRLVLADSGKNLGKFMLDTRSEYRRLDEKIFFLIRKFGKKDHDYKGTSLWQNFQELKDARNKIAHPKRDDTLSLTLESAEKYINTSEDVIEFISQHVWGKRAAL